MNQNEPSLDHLKAMQAKIAQQQAQIAQLLKSVAIDAGEPFPEPDEATHKYTNGEIAKLLDGIQPPHFASCKIICVCARAWEQHCLTRPGLWTYWWDHVGHYVFASQPRPELN